MNEHVNSIQENGVLSPVVVGPHKDGDYEILSGHRHVKACELAGIDEMSVIMKNFDDDTAAILLVDSNLQRENILPSEKAFAYQMKLEVMKRRTGRPSQENSDQIGRKYFGRELREILVEQIDESKNADDETVKKLTVTISGKTKDELMDLYGLTAKQREAVETLLEHGDVLTSSSHSLTITNADVQSIINGLPSSLPQKQKDVVKNAGSLVGKVNYFWGGKSSAIGWDSAWGTMRRVTAAGSPSSGTLRAYGLDCSGFVTWAFNNSGMGYAVGHGTYGQRDVSIQVSASTVQAGDLCFLPSYSHVGIVVGKDTSGNILVIHCSSGANNVVVVTASSVGFTVFRRPNCY